MDVAKYRAIFLEEAVEHLAEMSRALLDLEKDQADGEAIDLVFRMAHSIKGMASSLGYDSITEVSHLLEDRMHTMRTEGRVPPGDDGIGLLFRGLEGLERMVGVVRDTGEPPPADEALASTLSCEGEPPASGAGSAEAAADPAQDPELAAVQEALRVSGEPPKKA